MGRRSDRRDQLELAAVAFERLGAGRNLLTALRRHTRVRFLLIYLAEAFNEFGKQEKAHVIEGRVAFQKGLLKQVDKIKCINKQVTDEAKHQRRLGRPFGFQEK